MKVDRIKLFCFFFSFWYNGELIKKTHLMGHLASGHVLEGKKKEIGDPLIKML